MRREGRRKKRNTAHSANFPNVDENDGSRAGLARSRVDQGVVACCAELMHDG